MKDSIKIFSTALLFFASLAFTFQAQNSVRQYTPKAKTTAHEAQLARELEKTRLELEKSKKEIAEEIRKRDSVDAERQATIDFADKSVSELKAANKAFKKSLSRLVYEAAVKKSSPDTVMKYYGEYLDPNDIPVDTVKKKIEYPEVTAPVKKRTFFQRIFKRNH